MKKCCVCKEEKPLTAFGKNAALKDGLMGFCRVCVAARSKAWRLRNPERTRAYFRAFAYVNADRRKVYIKEWLAAHPEKSTVYLRKYRERHPERRSAQRILQTAVKAGEVQVQACRVCGEAKVEAHHPTYSLPLDVVWLCRKHHMEVHRKR